MSYWAAFDAALLELLQTEGPQMLWQLWEKLQPLVLEAVKDKRCQWQPKRAMNARMQVLRRADKIEWQQIQKHRPNCDGQWRVKGWKPCVKQ